MTFDQVQQYDRDGFVLVNDLFTAKEIEILLSQVTASGRVAKHTGNMPDAIGAPTAARTTPSRTSRSAGAATANPNRFRSCRATRFCVGPNQHDPSASRRTGRPLPDRRRD